MPRADLVTRRRASAVLPFGVVHLLRHCDCRVAVHALS
jgi:hypothetical protein